MKKLIFYFWLFTIMFTRTLKPQESCFTGALSAGYVFKHDKTFKEIYGHGIVNIITADGCYYPRENWGIGTKISYWSKHGKTTFLKKRTHLQEIPITFYIRKRKDFNCRLQMYASLGGGLTLIKEKSYLGNMKLHKGIGEVEIGLNYLAWHHMNLTTAIRYLFPRQSDCAVKMDIGGLDLRLGIEFPF